MPELPERLSAALAGRYVLRRELGRGGMATVYLADDVKHGRQVAIKVLLPEIAELLGGQRFLREIGIAAQLTHPHILPLHDSGSADGFLYYVMPYIAGESLRDRLTRTGPLGLEEALRITREVAEALDHAHREGFVHRDVKPENILLVSGHAVLADFGIAMTMWMRGEQRLTESGIVIGTPAYMSPEQLSGHRLVDGRADQYSLACVFQETLTGAPPAGNGTESTKSRSRPIRRALSADPARRYATIADFAAALVDSHNQGTKRWWIIGAATAAALVGTVVWAAQAARPGSLVAQGLVKRGDRILIARFTSHTGDSTIAAVAVEGLRVILSSDPSLVRPLEPKSVQEALARMGRAADTPLDDSIALELALRTNAAGYIMGDISRLGSGLQLTARIMSGTGHELWSGRARAASDDRISDALDDIGGQMLRRIGESLKGSLNRPSLVEVTTSSMPALRDYSEALDIEAHGGDRARAIALLRSAIAEDTTFASAYRSLGAEFSNNDQAGEAQYWTEKAYIYRDRLPANEQLFVEYQHFRNRLALAEAERSARRLIDEDPSDPFAWTALSDLRLAQRRFPEAESAAVVGMRLRPGNTIDFWNRVEALVAQGRFGAVDSLVATIPTGARHTLYAYDVAMAKRRWAEARAWADSVADPAAQRTRRRWHLSLSGRLHAFEEGAVSSWYVLRLLRYTGDTARARSVFDQVWQRLRFDSFPPRQRGYWVVVPVLAELGRTREARELLAQWERLAPDDPRLRSDLLWAKGALALAEGRSDSAVAAFLAWHAAPFATSGTHPYSRGLYEAAVVMDRTGRPDSALSLLERAFAEPGLGTEVIDGSWQPVALRRLGELHDSLGHRDQAIRYYTEFVDLWKDADPELQPQVRRARARLAALQAQRS